MSLARLIYLYIFRHTSKTQTYIFSRKTFYMSPTPQREKKKGEREICIRDFPDQFFLFLFLISCFASFFWRSLIGKLVSNMVVVCVYVGIAG